MSIPARILALLLAAPAALASAPCPRTIPDIAYEIVAVRKHDRQAFTQGLVFHQGQLLESTGRYGHSRVQVVDPESGAVWRRQLLGKTLFGEGLAVHDNKIWQLTWKAGRVLVYALPGLRPVAEHRYSGEGWGLTSDGAQLVMSDGSHWLSLRDPTDFSRRSRVAVRAGSRPLSRLNELEYVDGAIYANIWGSDRIARIALASGCVTGWLDLSELMPKGERDPAMDVLNGIAYDPASDIFYVTGKLWPKMFLLRLKP